MALENRGEFADFLQRVLTSEAKQICEVRLRSDRTSLPVLVEGIAAQDWQGPARLCRAAVIDMTQEKHRQRIGGSQCRLASGNRRPQSAEETVRRAKEEWEQTFDTVPDFVAVLDEQYRIVRHNRPMAQRLGITPSSAWGCAATRPSTARTSRPTSAPTRGPAKITGNIPPRCMSRRWAGISW